MLKRTFLALLPAVLALAAPGALLAQPAYPTGPVRIIVPVAAGGTVDITTRALAARLAAALGQSVVVENKTGGAGVPATVAAIRAPADGQTLYMGTIGTIGVNPLLMKTPPYDPQRDLLPISIVAEVPGVLVTHPSVPANSVAELIRYAKQNPGKLNFGTPGNGTSPHMAAELFMQQAGVEFVHVPYQGTAPAMGDLLTGRIHLYFDNIITSRSHIQQGRLKGLAVTGAKRSPLLPALPTVSESGLRGFEVTGWLGLMAPAGTPPAVVRRLSAEIQKIAQSPDMKNQVVGAEWIGSTPEEFAGLIKSENERWAAVIKAAKLQQD